MEEPYGEGVANHTGLPVPRQTGPESCAGVREGSGEALYRGTCGPAIEPRNPDASGCRRCIGGRDVGSEGTYARRQWGEGIRGMHECQAGAKGCYPSRSPARSA